MILSGCDFSPESILKSTGDFFTQTIPNEFNKFLDGMLGRKSEEPQKEEKEEKSDDEGKEEQQKQLVSISVSGQFKELYDIGEEFDPTGIVVTAVYDDQSSKDVSSQTSFSGFDSSAAGSTTVTVSFGGQSAELTLSVAKLSWFAEEKALFDEHLHGIELPFFPVEGAVLSADDEGTLHIFDAAGENLAVSGSTIADYAALFSAADGWEDVSSDYGAYSSAEAGSFWVFEKSTQTSEGMRRISVQFFGHNGSAYANDGSFYMFASDPFSYEFPADLMAEEFESYGFTPFTLPAPDADGLWFEFYPDSNNDLYYEFGYEDYMNATIYFYGFTQEGFDAYVAKLEQAGWVFTSQVMQGVTVRSGSLEIENVGSALIEQLYLYGNYAALCYDYLIAEPAAWPAEAAAALVEKFAPGSSTVIPACPDGTSYTPYMSTNYNEIDVGGDSSLKDSYAAILKEAGWTETEDGSYIFISPAQDIQITLVFTSYGLEIRVAAYIPPSAQWPAEDAAKLLPAGGQDSLPPFEGANSYQYYSDNYGSGITCFVGEGNEDSAMEAYATTLTTAGFIPDNNGFFKSPHDEFKVELWKGTDGAFNIEVTIIPHWPTADAAAGILALDSSFTDTLPAHEGAEKYIVSSTSEKLSIRCAYSTSAELNAALESYEKTLKDAGFEYAGVDAYDTPFYNSPNDQFNVNPWLSSYGYLVIDVLPGVFVPPTAGWPAEDIANFLKSLDPTITDVVPEFETDGTFVFDDSGYYADLELGLSFDSSDEASAAVTSYQATLVQAGYTALGQGYYGTVYGSPNGQLQVCAYAYGSDFYIDINLAS